jgi:hypothetical protein
LFSPLLSILNPGDFFFSGFFNSYLSFFISNLCGRVESSQLANFSLMQACSVLDIENEALLTYDIHIICIKCLIGCSCSPS